eukprot:scaffold272587_cov30-Tisochrysis_lutea.AAC.2
MGKGREVSVTDLCQLSFGAALRAIAPQRHCHVLARIPADSALCARAGWRVGRAGTLRARAHPAACLLFDARRGERPHCAPCAQVGCPAQPAHGRPTRLPGAAGR